MSLRLLWDFVYWKALEYFLAHDYSYIRKQYGVVGGGDDDGDDDIMLMVTACIFKEYG